MNRFWFTSMNCVFGHFSCIVSFDGNFNSSSEIQIVTLDLKKGFMHCFIVYREYKTRSECFVLRVLDGCEVTFDSILTNVSPDFLRMSFQNLKRSCTVNLLGSYCIFMKVIISAIVRSLICLGGFGFFAKFPSKC